MKAGILRKVKHQTWVANPVMVKKSEGGWRMCVDCTDINKACPKDCYPLPEIDWKVESLRVSAKMLLGCIQRKGDETPKDYLIEVPLEDNKKETKEKADTKPAKTSCEWKLFTDGAKTKEALKGFDSYTIEHIRRNQNKKADALSKLTWMTFEHLTKEVLVEVLSKRSIEDKEILQVETKEGESWMTPIHVYLVSGLLPEDPKESRMIKVKAPQCKLIRGNLYRRSFYTLWFRCVASPQTDDIVN
ncbi:hypothetical protein Tco_0803384 [Tanacetum coccineum]|uniref:Reverse transcriptase domain-containing protein n=1 Tax=Tanacetum coccineum TaxID=301880 RepID=A0ABQ5A3W0_9ASTR